MLLVDDKFFNLEHKKGDNGYLVNVNRIFTTLKAGFKEETAQVQLNNPSNPNVINGGRSMETNEIGSKLDKPCGPIKRLVLNKGIGFRISKFI